MELQNHKIKKRTAHYTQTQYIHCTYNTEEPPNQSHGRTREPSPKLWNRRTTALQKKMHITQGQNTYDVLTILRNHRTKVVVELENLALNYGTAEPQHYTKNCTLHRDTIHTVYLQYRGTTEPKSW